MTIYDIKRLTQETEPKYFSDANLRFFGQTMESFTVQKQGKYFRISAPIIDHRGKNMGESVAYFDPATKHLLSERTFERENNQDN